MELDDSSGVKRCLESQLTQNSTITVTIDDLTEGLIVVSFTQGDNLYQGVLFQLNRERGIPSGISFAKEHVLGITSVEKNETDPLQTTPLHQRHSYNQGTCNGASHSSVSQPSLRRIIKPPARFKNARMSLRLRARPVLCAKCKSLCDDKADSSGKDESKDENPPEKSKKDRMKVGKIEGSGSGSTSTAIGLNNSGKLQGNQPTQGMSATDPQDLCYESVGSTRVVENYWRRPLVQPLNPSTEELYARLRKHRTPMEAPRENRKKVKTTNNAITVGNTFINNDSSTATMVHQEKFAQKSTCSSSDNVAVPEKLFTNNSTFVTKINVCDNNFPNTRSRKALNLKMCITKIAEMRNGDKCSKESGINKPIGMLIQKKATSTVNPSVSPLHHHSESSLESLETMDSTGPTQQDKTSSDESGVLKTRASGKRSKAWENRIRTKSTVPVRYRDERYLTKDIFNFNKRRPLTNSGDIPVLTICRSDDENIFKVSTLMDPEGTDTTVTTSKLDDNDEVDNEEMPVSSVQSSSSSSQEPSVENENDDDGYHHSPSSSSVINEVPAISIKSTIPKQTEIIKTPTIKITFGSSGNGMVVQIPPKVTQHLESSSTTEMKAVRKAMKRARKEAKRRRSISPDFSPSSNAVSPDHHPQSERSNPTSPITPTVHDAQEESDVSQTQDEKSFTEFNANEPSTSTRVPKKKKKQKKRRRSSKVLKENDGFTSSSSSHHEPTMYNNMSSPHSTSSYNQGSSCGDHENSSTTSVKNYSLTDTVSNSCTQEPVPSFYKDAGPPRRRRSMPATSTTSNSVDAPRVCINLKRINTNAYVPLHSISSHSDNDGPSVENNGVDTDECELHDVPVNNGNLTVDSFASTGESVEYYKDKETEFLYRKGDIIWGKLPACPWWPGKIDDILTRNEEETCAKVSWYKSTTQSCVRFKMLVPFKDCYESKYSRSRRRGFYQLAVRDALVEGLKLNPENSSTD